ncbi:MAG: DNA polymerase III subunit delta [Verrucomicrobiales bacterium]|jgi:DNA polymerase-3 subunit delta|nr:DNA polymerase III subunit delta [Verrucomicrobiales bacterium]MDB4632585.1 DNA polymerase III subunit delta [bacterium]MDC0312778.1 DNA polymerase III subunit delta [Verrucomicrobiales bacterium]MDF1785154.1 DNA polymerase III subunit delta [Verrucomicrobiales bacterium]
MPPAKKKRAAKKKAPAKKAKKADNLFVFVGTDEGRVRQAAHDCFTKQSEGLDEFGAETIDGTSENSEDASRIVGRTLEALQTLPFFGGNKVVWLKNANFVGDSVTGNSKTTQSALEGITDLLVHGLPSEVTFILSASAVDKRRVFYKRLNERANVETFDKPDTSRDGWEEAVMQYVSAEASKRGLRFQRQGLELFAMLLGAETQQVDQELEKLDLFIGERRDVTPEDIRHVVSLSRGGVIFEIGNALSKRQLTRVLHLIDHLLYRGESAVGILLGSIVPQVRRLLQAKDLIQRFRIQSRNYQDFNRQLARLPREEVAHLPMKKDGTPNAYPIFLSSMEASNFRVDELRRGLEACLEANLRLVTTGLDHKVVLNQLVIQLLARKSR